MSHWRTFVESRVLAGLWIAMSAAVAVAQPAAPTVKVSQSNGFVVCVPNENSPSQRSGLQLEVDTRWINNYGYRPVRIRVASPAPTTAAHSITLRLYVASANDWQEVTSIEQDFEMPLGSTAAATVVACPQLEVGQGYWWEVWIDGIKDAELSVDRNFAWQFFAASSAQAANQNLKFLVVDSRTASNRVYDAGSDLFETLITTESDLPTRWLDYTAIDVVSLSTTQLRDLAQTRPAALQALERWVRSGGQIWVGEVGSDWEQLDDVEHLLDMPPAPLIREEALADRPKPSSGAPGDSDSSTGDPPSARGELDPALIARGWRPVAFDQRQQQPAERTFTYLPSGATRTVRDPDVVAEMKRNPDWVTTSREQPSASPGDAANRSSGPADSSPWYVQRPLDLGLVRIFRRTWEPAEFAMVWRIMSSQWLNDTSNTPMPVEVALDTMRDWESRHGMVPDAPNRDFASLLVPGVGLAPVTEFRVLITLFVLAIGPVNYWWLKRTNRLYLLVLTVPLTAAAMTVGLFAYALVSDGFATRARVRSFTKIDQPTGEAVCWARLSYYAGLAPGAGLTLPDDLAIYPIPSGWNSTPPPQTSEDLHVSRQMDWSGRQLRLPQGWLRSRTPTQYLTVRARTSPRRLQFSTSTPEGLSVSNELDSEIRYLAAMDQRGQFYVGETIDDGAAASLSPATEVEVLRELRSRVIDNHPETPPGLNQRSSFLAGVRGRSGMRRQGSGNSGPERLESNLMNDEIRALVGNGTEPPLNLPPQSYVAITSSGPEVALGIAGAHEEESFHVVVGRW